MELLAPWWVYALFFLYTSFTHLTMKLKRFPLLPIFGVIVQSIGIGLFLTGIAMLVWR